MNGPEPHRVTLDELFRQYNPNADLLLQAIQEMELTEGEVFSGIVTDDTIVLDTATILETLLDMGFLELEEPQEPKVYKLKTNPHDPAEFTNWPESRPHHLSPRLTYAAGVPGVSARRR